GRRVWRRARLCRRRCSRGRGGAPVAATRPTAGRSTGARCEPCGGDRRAPMGGADRDWYSRLHQLCVEDGWTVSKLETLATVVGAFAAWCTSSRAVWTVPDRVGPGSSRSTERSGPVEFPPVLRTPGVWSLGSSR